MQILKAVELVKTFRGREIVRGVNIEIQEGEIVGLLGPNGAGKTTIFYIVVGLTRPESGNVFLSKREITRLPMYQRARLGIGYLPQEPSVFRKLTVEENILAILETMSLTGRERKTRAEMLMEELNILHVKDTKAYALSGGERRRVEICRTLVTSPYFILLDEPFAGIDPIAVIDIQNIISQLKKRGIGILITDHNVRETLEITDRAYIINEGEIIDSGSPEEIARSEKARKFYLGENFTL
ncbi:MAG: LPS export ABC transporter ATP-binding protein [Nitrospinae bacterium RIFCSPLOWO2_02_FULL_39_110]|nr:MAG: LPS export ABC transporter ATP-binding protein [Nitrospinae bacterium RIFCSPHIGHO2_02_39_11]OGV98200.1 MAG: LPS export ABC transporter ATP-binding protein [Nitrospinae bacterium RIFCSPHIGHO2_12_FULL_39_42]OGV99663.1 MAG: LPS export ABC transporter ATP-binding protein [Nitrospinae bacterium RIFCSPHIGHO2_02_FULL_39_82]OGW01504.1 MAG: LPS export ABC transporter ATP-binding protein [Nitrospinae bacterium RIFCSPLOWO2_02_39_17]OGW03819.1 MAG: LPS export ABC transporter ATP-binding protein [Ni